MNEPQPHKAGTAYRVLTAAFGLLLVAVGLYALAFAEVDGFLRYAAGCAFVLVGGNAVYAAVRSTESWLSRIGPLP